MSELHMTMDVLLIEKSRAENIPYLVRLKDAIMTSEYTPPAVDDNDWNRWRETYCTNEFFHSLMADRTVSIYHMGSLREPAGMMVLIDHGDTVELDDLLVSKTESGRGIGKRLIKCAIAYAKVWRKKKIIIDIYSGHERTEAFLAAHGFALEGEATNDLGMPMYRWSKVLS